MGDENTKARIRDLVASAANKPHGTRSRYHSGCGCLLCRSANSRYECARAIRLKAGQTGAIVSAELVRQHIEKLSAFGIGYKSVADAASVSRTILCEVKSGKRTRIRATTERRVLAVDHGALPASALVSAAPTWRSLEYLLGLGYSKRQLAIWMGLSGSIQFRRDLITHRNAVRVERLCRKIELGLLQRPR